MLDRRKEREKEATIPCSLNLDVGGFFCGVARRYGFRGFIAHKPEEMNESVSKGDLHLEPLRSLSFLVCYLTDTNIHAIY